MRTSPDDSHSLPPLFSRAVTGCIYACLIAAALTGFACCLWGLRRGFDITDESYFLLLAIHSHTFKIFVSAVHWLTSPLWSVTGTLFRFRLAGLSILLSASLTLAFGIARASATCGIPLASWRSAAMTIAVCTLVATLHLGFYGVTAFFTPSYNLLAASASYCALGLILLALDIHSRRLATLLHFFAGGSIAVVFLCKFPAGINVSALALFVIFAFGAATRARVFNILSMLAGVGLGMLLITLSQMSPADALANFRLGVRLYGAASQESASVRLMRNAGELFDNYRFTVFQFALPLSWLLAVPAIRFPRFVAGCGIVVLAAAVISGGYLYGDTRPQPVEAPLTGPELVSTALRSATALLAIMLSFLIATFPAWAQNRKAILFSGMLFALPYCLSLGTSNPFPQQILVFLASWGALLGLLPHSCKLIGHRRITALLLSAMFVSVTTAQMLFSVSAPAYHQNHSMREQTEPMRIGSIGVVRTDSEMSVFLNGLTGAARTCAIGPGRPFLGLYDIPGVALVIGAVPIMTPWLSSEEQAAAWLKIASPDAIHSAVIGLHLYTDGKLQKISGILPTFPVGYRLCGTATYPFDHQKIQLWVPQ